ncbi:MAG: hypothetical protein ILP13_03545 [Lachnospiraceae bacterium]|nr:hypothetical protein [Lachnospiraceae bacterium]
MAETKTKKPTSNEYIDNIPGFSLEIPKNAPRNALVKWYQQKMSYEEKYRMGLLTYPEYLEWQQELMNAEEAKTTPVEEGSTFWSGDTELRSNISNSDYEDFLAQNNVDVSNSTTVDFEKLKNELD